MLNENQRNDISRYAEKFLKVKMDSEMPNGGAVMTDHILDGSNPKDYQQSFSHLQNMIDRTLDDYKEEL